MYYISPRDLSRQYKEEIVKILISYINDNSVSCSDAVFQTDRHVINAPAYMSMMVKIVEDRIVED